MVHKIPVAKANYSLLGQKQRFSYSNALIIIVIFLISFTSLGFLAVNFSKTAISEEKLVDNVKVPLWLQWLWNHYSGNSTTFGYNMKSNDEHLLVCYYFNGDTTKLAPNNIDPHLCTHIIIGFASIKNSTIYLGNNLNVYKQVVELKKNSDLKVMFSVGGAGDDNGFPEMVMNDDNRQIFIQSVLNALDTLNLDGLDLDWEFPSTSDIPGLQRIHFVQLIYELKKSFEQHNRKLLLSIAVAAPTVIIDKSYDIPELAEYVDFINLMSYDYHFYTWYDPVTNLNSPVFTTSQETGYLATLNVNYSANYWVLKGMPKEKIVVGIPLYGHSYKLYNPLNHDLKAPASGFGDIGGSGFVSYPEVCKFLKNGASRVLVKDSHVPYAYKDKEWISYDDVSSVTFKAMWIKSNGFKGAMIYSLNSDDWNSICTPNHKYPLLKAIKKVFN